MFGSGRIIFPPKARPPVIVPHSLPDFAHILFRVSWPFSIKSLVLLSTSHYCEKFWYLPKCHCPGLRKGRLRRSFNVLIGQITIGSLLSFVKAWRRQLVRTEREKGPGYHLRFNESARSVWIVWLQQRRHRHRPTKRLQVPEMKLNLSTASAHLEPRAHELLNSIANMWPPAIRSNVRLFFSMMIHFAIEQINSEKLGNHRQRQQKG